jgi:Domain of unknown function (DUF4375)
MIAPEERIAAARGTYGRTITEILAKEPDHDLYQILGAIEVLVGSKISRKLPTTLSERMIFAFTWLAREVQNGGFHQYFFNSAGDYWRDALEGLVAIGDEHGLAMFRQTLSIFPDGTPSTDRFTRQDQLEVLDEEDEDGASDHFSRMTNQYFSSPFPNWQLVYDYVKSHKEQYDLHGA